MIYIVYSPEPRSGTSMLMQCLVAGGLIPVYSKYREKVMVAHNQGEYVANERFYEAGNWLDVTKFDGKLIKKIGDYNLPSNSKAVILTRNPEEIRQSWWAFDGSQIDAVPFEIAYNKKMDKIKETLRPRDVIWNYREVVAEPLKHFESLDWPIDAQKASLVPDVTKVRYKIEELDYGV